MRVLALDLSTKTGWSLFEGETLLDYGLIETKVHNFNVNDFPDHEPDYPFNILESAQLIVHEVFTKLINTYQVEAIVIENTVKGRNRHTQRILEWIHCLMFLKFKSMGYEGMNQKAKLPILVYLDPSAWRKILEVRLSNLDKKNNRLVSQKKKRGRVTRKHLAVRRVNELYGLSLKIKDNNQCDAILLGLAYIKSNI